MTLHERLKDLNACREAIDWAKPYATLDEAWAVCERGDWMLWLAARMAADHKAIVRAACDCARLALPYTDDPRVLACIETTEAWTRGEATIEHVAAARAAASDAASDAAWAASDAARAAAWAARDAARDAASAASDAARAASDAWAARDAAVRRQCADLVRKYIPKLEEQNA